MRSSSTSKNEWIPVCIFVFIFSAWGKSFTEFLPHSQIPLYWFLKGRHTKSTCTSQPVNSKKGCCYRAVCPCSFVCYDDDYRLSTNKLSRERKMHWRVVEGRGCFRKENHNRQKKKKKRRAQMKRRTEQFAWIQFGIYGQRRRASCAKWE